MRATRCSGRCTSRIPQSSRWVPFFRDYRLLFMAREAQREGASAVGDASPH